MHFKWLLWWLALWRFWFEALVWTVEQPKSGKMPMKDLGWTYLSKKQMMQNIPLCSKHIYCLETIPSVSQKWTDLLLNNPGDSEKSIPHLFSHWQCIWPLGKLYSFKKSNVCWTKGEICHFSLRSYKCSQIIPSNFIHRLELQGIHKDQQVQLFKWAKKGWNMKPWCH